MVKRKRKEEKEEDKNKKKKKLSESDIELNLIINKIEPKKIHIKRTKQVLKEVSDFINEKHDCQTFLYGSWKCGLAINQKSDLDISLLPNSKLDIETENIFLKKVFNHFKKHIKLKCLYIPAKHPLIKLFTDGVIIDISMKDKNFDRDELIIEYLNSYHNCREVMLLLKYWAKIKRLINTPKDNNHFSSYVFYIIVLNFFVKNIEKEEENKSSFDLIFEFFKYYSNFNFDYIISINRKKEMLRFDYTHHPMFVECPHFIGNNVCLSLNHNNFDLFLRECENALIQIQNGEINKIFKWDLLQ
eukprot:gene5064-8664_t